jgi:hypothetical protein
MVGNGRKWSKLPFGTFAPCRIPSWPADFPHLAAGFRRSDSGTALSAFMPNPFDEAVERFVNTFLGAILGDPRDSITVNFTRPPGGQPYFLDCLPDGGSRWPHRGRWLFRLGTHIGFYSIVALLTPSRAGSTRTSMKMSSPPSSTSWSGSKRSANERTRSGSIAFLSGLPFLLPTI